MQPTPVFLPRESHGQQSLVGYGPRGHKESDMTEANWHAHMLLKDVLSVSQFWQLRIKLLSTPCADF